MIYEEFTSGVPSSISLRLNFSYVSVSYVIFYPKFLSYLISLIEFDCYPSPHMRTTSPQLKWM